MSFNVILDQGIDLSVRANLEIQFWIVNSARLDGPLNKHFPVTPTFLKAGAGAVQEQDAIWQRFLATRKPWLINVFL